MDDQVMWDTWGRNAEKIYEKVGGGLSREITCLEKIRDKCNSPGSKWTPTQWSNCFKGISAVHQSKWFSQTSKRPTRHSLRERRWEAYIGGLIDKLNGLFASGLQWEEVHSVDTCQYLSTQEACVSKITQLCQELCLVPLETHSVHGSHSTLYNFPPVSQNFLWAASAGWWTWWTSPRSECWGWTATRSAPGTCPRRQCCACDSPSPSTSNRSACPSCHSRQLREALSSPFHPHPFLLLSC